MVLEDVFNTNSERVVKALQDMLGSNFKVGGGGWSDIIVEIKSNGQFVPFAKVTAPTNKNPIIFVTEEAAIRDAQGLAYIEHRSTYRKIADTLKGMNIGPVNYYR